MSDDPQNTGEKGTNAAFVAQAGKGRPKGVQNKTTKLMKAAIEAVMADLQQAQRDAEGSDNEYAHFLQWAKDNETEFYKLASKLIPIQLAGDPENPLPTGFTVSLVSPAKD